jgi:hypothetical protein
VVDVDGWIVVVVVFDVADVVDTCSVVVVDVDATWPPQAPTISTSKNGNMRLGIGRR